MTTVLKPSDQNIPEVTDINITKLRNSNIFTVTTTSFIIDCSISDYIKLNLMSDVLISFSNATKEGQQLTLAIYQADVVAHSVAFDSSVRLGTDIFSIPTLSSSIGLLDRIIFIYDSVANKYDLCGFSRGY